MQFGHWHALLFGSRFNTVAGSFQTFRAGHTQEMPEGHFQILRVGGGMPIEAFAGFLVMTQQREAHADLPVFGFLVRLQLQKSLPVLHGGIHVTKLELIAATHLIDIGKSRPIRQSFTEILHRPRVVADEIKQLTAFHIGKRIGGIQRKGALQQLHHGIGLTGIQRLNGLQKEFLLLHLGERHRRRFLLSLGKHRAQPGHSNAQV